MNNSPLLRPEQIRTASLYPLATLEARTAGTGRILITRYWPRGVRKSDLTLLEWERELAPTATLLKSYNAGAITWDQFAENYRFEMRPMFWSWRNWIRAQLRLTSAVTLLCHEHDAPEETVRCHRRLLREMLLEQTGGDGDVR